MKDLMELNKFRQPELEIQLYGAVGDSSNGVFALRSPADGKALRVIVSTGYGWEHVSVSKINKTPTWGEMEFVKRMFFKPEEVCMQLHVAVEEHISIHKFCLHIWRPTEKEIPLPPSWMVG